MHLRGEPQHEPTSKFATESGAEASARMLAPIKEPGLVPRQNYLEIGLFEQVGHAGQVQAHRLLAGTPQANPRATL
jgi:hypothetical protein